MTSKPRIYAACLAGYNNGHLHGVWIDATQGEWAIETDIQTMLASSPIAGAEEWAIHDYEGFAGISLSEYEGVQRVVRLARFVSDHGEVGAKVLEYYGGDLDESEEALNDRYLGEYASLADFMQETTEEAVTMPQTLQSYVDWNAMARDAELSGDVLTFETAYDVVHVFAGH